MYKGTMKRVLFVSQNWREVCFVPLHWITLIIIPHLQLQIHHFMELAFPFLNTQHLRIKVQVGNQFILATARWRKFQKFLITTLMFTLLSSLKRTHLLQRATSHMNLCQTSTWFMNMNGWRKLASQKMMGLTSTGLPIMQRRREVLILKWAIHHFCLFFEMKLIQLPLSSIPWTKSEMPFHTSTQTT